MDGNDLVRVDIEGHVAKVVLNRPEKLKALNKQIWSMVGDSFSELNKMDYLIMAAAVSDFKPKKISKTKIKKNIKKTFNLELVKNIDIISELSKLKKNNQKVIGFALETENEIANAKNKLKKKHLDAIVLNSISDENTCFNSEKNKIHFITKSKTKKFKLKFKNEVAKDILHEIYNL